MSFHFSFPNFEDFSFFIIDARGKGREKERERKRNIDMREISIGCLPPGYVP